MHQKTLSTNKKAIHGREKANHNYIEQTGCHGVRGWGADETGYGHEEVQTSTYKISKSRG